jgi:hypothetical protein
MTLAEMARLLVWSGLWRGVARARGPWVVAFLSRGLAGVSVDRRRKPSGGLVGR